MRDVICLINLIQEIQDFGVKFPSTPSPKATCRVFEDNVGALELANTHKLCPRTKHLTVQLHHFCQCTLDKKALVEKIATTHQRADVFAKALPRDAFRCLRRSIIGWQDFARECHEHEIHDGIHTFLQCILRIRVLANTRNACQTSGLLRANDRPWRELTISEQTE